MSQAPTVSVIIPLYNKAGYIVRAVRSALAQQPQPDEVLIVDDGSTDDGLRVLEQIPEYSRIRIVRQSNAGEGAARNRGLREMRGELAAFLDADDEWLPGHIASILELARTYPHAGLLATGYRSVYRRGVTVETAIAGREPVLVSDYFEAARGGYCLHISSSAVYRKVALDVGGFAEGEPMGADLDFYPRVALHYPVALHPAISGLYYAHNPGSAIHTNRWTNAAPPVVRLLRDSEFASPSLARSASAYADWILEEHALTGLCAGRRRDAVKLLRKFRSGGPASRCPARIFWIIAEWLPVAFLRLMIRWRRSRYSVSNTVGRHTIVNKVLQTHAH